MFKWRSRYIVVFLLVGAMLAGWLTGCTANNPAAKDNLSYSVDSQAVNHARQDGKLIAITSIFSLYDFTRYIGGDEVAVFNILPAGADAHDFEPTAKQTMELAKADMFIYNGAGFELWIDKVLQSLGNEQPLKVVNATDGLPLLENAEEEEEHDHEHTGIVGIWYSVLGFFGYEHDHHHDHGPADPHVWLNPQLALMQAEKVRDTLIELRPEQEPYFTENFNALKTELLQLDQAFADQLRDVSNRSFVVSHSGYAYLAERYQLEQIAISGIHPGSEPSNQELQQIIDYLQQSDNKYVFFETSVSNKVADVVAKETGAEVLVLQPLENVTAEDLQKQATYTSIMYENLDNLIRGLGK